METTGAPLLVAQDLSRVNSTAAIATLAVEHDIPGDEREREPERDHDGASAHPVNFTTIAVTSSCCAAPRANVFTRSTMARGWPWRRRCGAA